MNQTQLFYFTLILSLIFVIGTLILVILAVNIVSPQYQMPNGVICDYKKIVSAGLGGAGIEFKECNDGKTYINPKNYRKLKR